MSERDLDELQNVIGHEFSNLQLLQTALTHRSYANENRTSEDSEVVDNERLEFLGDAVLDLVVGHRLMERYPDQREGELSVTRAQVVSEAGLSEVARSIELGDWLFLGKGEQRSGGRDKPSILADALEAVIAAVYLDAGFDAARALVDRLMTDAIDHVRDAGPTDFKTAFQEAAQARLKVTPEYTVIGSSGPDHDKTFEVGVVIDGETWATASGKSKKEAEQRAAEAAHKLLDERS